MNYTRNSISTKPRKFLFHRLLRAQKWNFCTIPHHWKTVFAGLKGCIPRARNIFKNICELENRKWQQLVHKICCRKLTVRHFRLYVSYSVDLPMRSSHLLSALFIGICCDFTLDQMSSTPSPPTSYHSSFTRHHSTIYYQQCRSSTNYRPHPGRVSRLKWPQMAAAEWTRRDHFHRPTTSTNCPHPKYEPKNKTTIAITRPTRIRLWLPSYFRYCSVRVHVLQNYLDAVRVTRGYLDTVRVTDKMIDTRVNLLRCCRNCFARGTQFYIEKKSLAASIQHSRLNGSST